MDDPAHEKMFQDEIAAKLATVLQANPNLTHIEAMQEVTRHMLANNPFIPPKGCPINDLPNELLAQIFYLGTKMGEEDEDSDGDDDEDAFDDELNLLDGWETEEEEERPLGPGDEKTADSDMADVSPTATKTPKDDEESDEESDDESDEEPTLPFQILVSHVCRSWRAIATDTPSLWTTLHFEVGSSLDQAKAYIERSKSLPLDISIDCVAPEEWVSEDYPDGMDIDEEEVPTLLGLPTPPPQDASVAEDRSIDTDYTPSLPFLTKDQLTDILDIIIPHVERWRVFEVQASQYESHYTILSRLAECPSAPVLETLQLYQHDDCEDYDVFQPVDMNTKFLLFHGIVPNLKNLALWGVHIDWDASLSFLSGLSDLEMAYHPNDVRPSFQTFASMLNACPELKTLSLSLSGPAGHKEDWGSDPIEIPSLEALALSYHEAAYIEALYPLLSAPNVIALTLDYDSDDFTAFSQLLCKPHKGRKRSLLAGLERLKIAGLPCDRKTKEQILGELTNLKEINLNCSGDEEDFFEKLQETEQQGPNRGKKLLYCPNLHSITSTGIDGKRMKKFVEGRRLGGAPLKGVYMSQEDDVEEKEENWFRKHVDNFDYFEPSESEDEFDEYDEEMEEEGDDEA